jgi:hypothetical protein
MKRTAYILLVIATLLLAATVIFTVLRLAGSIQDFSVFLTTRSVSTEEIHVIAQKINDKLRSALLTILVMGPIIASVLIAGIVTLIRSVRHSPEQ